MPSITLPDGSVREYAEAVSIMQVAADIGAGLAKATLAGMIDGKLLDASHVIGENCTLRIITDKDEEGLEVIRHSAAHLLAQAVKAIFPTAQVTIGPVIADGFYYDFAFERSFTPEDLQAIEKKMEELAKQDFVIERTTKTRDEAVTFFRDLGEEYKAKIIEDIPVDETLSLYQQGDFIDLCRGPHVPSTGKLKAVKLTKLAGAYWRGDSNNEMLQRIYGTAWPDKKSLKAYLHRLEEAEKRDHRKTAKKLDLFHLQDIAPGMVFWHERGWAIYLVMQQYIREKLRENGYHEIRTPEMVSRRLWEASGHWDKFSEEMYTIEADNHEYAIKPMNCPCHVQVYNQGLKSYRDLPLRLAEFGNCHRSEPSGTLHGLMRVRNFVQDDAHIFCTEDQIQAEVSDFIELIYQVYQDFGFNDIMLKLATRPDKRVGSDAVWDKAEQALEDAVLAKGLEYQVLPGEGAFYGPKIEFHLKDCIGRTWQCGTMQVDFSMPERLEATYIAEDGSKQTPVMLHRAIFGTFERFMGIMLEEFADGLPPWLAPIQLAVLNISEQQLEYCQNIANTLQNRGFRCHLDLRNEKIGFKIREQTIQRVPFLLVIGDREVEAKTVSVRSRDGQDLGSFSLDEFVVFLSGEIEKKARKPAED